MNASAPVRPWLLIVFGLVLLVGVLVGAGALARRATQRVAARKAQVRAARDDRQSLRVRPVPVPVPTSLPLLGPTGTDADGYPRQYVDRPGLRALLAARRFKDLTAYAEQRGRPRCR